MDEASALLAQKVKQDDQPPEAPKGRLLSKLNPASWFRGRKAAEPGVTALETLPGIASNSVPTETPPVKLVASRELTPAPVPRPLPGRRYTYRNPAPPSPGNRAKAAPYFAQALRDQRDGRLAEALEGYRKAVKADPSFFEAQYNLGLAAYELREVGPALSAYETALSIKPTADGVRYNFALALQEGSYFQDAANELERVLRDKPDQTRAQFCLATLYAEKLGQPTLARQHFRKVLELEPQHAQAAAIRYWLAANPE
jgi:tetratricopeptide (TPR) repeat protein